VNKPNVSGSIPSTCKSAFGWRSNVTGNFSARSRNGFGKAASVASTSANATAHNFSQFKFTSQRWRGQRLLATVPTNFFLALERCRFMVVGKSNL
jgi:hypothetical protein